MSKIGCAAGEVTGFVEVVGAAVSAVEANEAAVDEEFEAAGITWFIWAAVVVAGATGFAVDEVLELEAAKATGSRTGM